MKDKATFAGGCFWCTEAIFQHVEGVEQAVSGYAGGEIVNPSYEQVSTGATGHAECVQISFDPKKITYEKLVEIFMKTHDPTTPNQQGADVGTQYCSAIFYHNDEQKVVAEGVIDRLERERYYDNPIVTEIVPLVAFYLAEGYHQNFYNKNRNYPYCQVVIDPKIRKLLELDIRK